MISLKVGSLTALSRLGVWRTDPQKAEQAKPEPRKARDLPAPARAQRPAAAPTALRAKAEAAKKLIRAEKDYAKAFVLAADTVVAVGRRVLGKAELEDEAGDALRVLRGRGHREQ